MSWLSRGADERLVRAVQLRRDVQRGPLPSEGSPYAAESLGPMAFFAHPASVSVLLLIVFAILLLAMTSYYAAYSGAVRWILLAMILSAAAYVGVRYAAAKVQDPLRLGGRAAAGAGVGGDLASLRTTAERADGGLVYSQVVFEDRMRKAFLGKVRSNRAFTAAAFDVASRDLARLHDVLRDRELTVFVLEAARNMRAYPASLPTLAKRQEFAKRAAKTLEAMEAWR